MSAIIREERLKIPTIKGGQLFLRRLEQSENSKAAVLMLHGLGCDGDVYLNGGHGLATYLTELGFTCYVPDLVGHGQSWPHISRHLEHSVHDIIVEDIPRLIAEIERKLKGRPLFLIGQGFASTLLLAAFARNAELRRHVTGFVHLNSRRSTVISGVNHSLTSRLLWRHLLPFVSKLRGSVPLNWTPYGTQEESASWYQTFLHWSDGDWLDPVDQFNYSAAIRELSLPPSLYLAARSMGYWANTADVREFMRELGTHNGRMLILAKGDGNLRNYHALSMLKHDDAWVDHFPVILDWLSERARLPGSQES